MRWIPIALIGVHGLIHLMGFAKAFGYGDLPQLTQPISGSWGVWWLVAACLVTASAGLMGAGARHYWVVGTVALLVAQVVIFTAWRDAWAGTAANALLLLIVVHGWLTEGPQSFHAQYFRDAEAGLARVGAAAPRRGGPAPASGKPNLPRLPAPVQRYLRVTRSVGQPRVQSYRLRFRG